MAELVIPARLAASVVSWEGDDGRAWLADLPRLVTEVAEAWELEVGVPFEPGGNISWVAPARRRGDGLHAVLKLQHPHPESSPEADGLRAWAGDGAVLLHAAAVPEGLPTLASVLDPWADELEELLSSRSLVDPGLERLALHTMRTRPRAPGPSVLLHGDLNPTNLLATEREPWLAIDPKPMLGDAAYDGPRLVNQPDPLATADPAGTVARRLDLVASTMRIDREALAAWTLVGEVEMGASARSHGDHETAAACAVGAELIARHLP